MPDPQKHSYTITVGDNSFTINSDSELSDDELMAAAKSAAGPEHPRLSGIGKGLDDTFSVSSGYIPAGKAIKEGVKESVQRGYQGPIQTAKQNLQSVIDFGKGSGQAIGNVAKAAGSALWTLAKPVMPGDVKGTQEKMDLLKSAPDVLGGEADEDPIEKRWRRGTNIAAMLLLNKGRVDAKAAAKQGTTKEAAEKAIQEAERLRTNAGLKFPEPPTGMATDVNSVPRPLGATSTAPPPAPVVVPEEIQREFGHMQGVAPTPTGVAAGPAPAVIEAPTKTPGGKTAIEKAKEIAKAIYEGPERRGADRITGAIEDKAYEAMRAKQARKAAMDRAAAKLAKPVPAKTPMVVPQAEGAVPPVGAVGVTPAVPVAAAPPAIEPVVSLPVASPAEAASSVETLSNVAQKAQAWKAKWMSIRGVKEKAEFAKNIPADVKAHIENNLNMNGVDAPKLREQLGMKPRPVNVPPKKVPLPVPEKPVPPPPTKAELEKQLTTMLHSQDARVASDAAKELVKSHGWTADKLKQELKGLMTFTLPGEAAPVVKAAGKAAAKPKATSSVFKVPQEGEAAAVVPEAAVAPATATPAAPPPATNVIKVPQAPAEPPTASATPAAPTKGKTMTLAEMKEKYGEAGAARRAGFVEANTEAGLKSGIAELNARIAAGKDTTKLTQLLDAAQGAEATAKRLGISAEEVRAASGGKPRHLPTEAVDRLKAAADREIAATGQMSKRTAEGLARAAREEAERKAAEGGTTIFGGFPNPIPFIRENPKLAGAAAGGALGYAMTPDSATGDEALGGAAVGAGLGAGLAAAAGNFPGAGRFLGAARREGFLTGGAIPKNIATAATAPFHAATDIEGLTLKQRVGVLGRASKEMYNLPKNAQEFWTALKTGTPNSGWANKGHDFGRLSPSNVIGAIDATATRALQRAGISTKDIQHVLLTGDRDLFQGFKLSKEGRAASRLIIPFQRVPANVLGEAIEGYGNLLVHEPQRVAQVLGDVYHGRVPLKDAMKALPSVRTTADLAAIAAGYGMGEAAGNDPKSKYILSIVLAAFGPRQAFGITGALLGLGTQGLAAGAIGGISPIPEQAFDPRMALGTKPALFSAYEKLSGNKIEF